MSTEGHSYVGQLKDKIKKNERRINELEDKLKEHEEECEPKINDLQGEIRRLQEENVGLRKVIRNNETKIGELERSYEFQEAEIGDLKKQSKEHKAEIGDLKKQLKESELSEEALIIRELCSKVQQNILKIVLQNDFDEIENKSIKHIEKYITNQITEKHEQDEAKSRSVKLKKEIRWDDHLVNQLKSVTQRGNKTAHPHLDEKKINVAKKKLEAQKELGKHMVKAVDRLTDIWKLTNDKLTHGISSAKGEDQVGQKNRSSSGRDHDTYAGIAAKGAKAVHCGGPRNGLVFSASI